MTADAATLLALRGRTALVAGGCGGIGAATASLLRQAGARVLCLDLPGREPPEGCELLPCDLGSSAAIAQLAEPLDGAVDLLVHCAGITRDAVLWKLSEEDWSEVLRVNLDSAFHLLRLVVPGMRAKGHGAVVLVASINGERGKRGQSAYAASKAGLIALARTAAKELGRFGIRVNAVSPGWIDTDMTAAAGRERRQAAIDETALGRAGTPDDVARAILFLGGDLAAHITGQVLRVDGGQLTA